MSKKEKNKVLKVIKLEFSNMNSVIKDLKTAFKNKNIKNIKDKNKIEKKKFIYGICGLFFIIFLILLIIGIFTDDTTTKCKKLKNGYFSCSDIIEEEYDKNNNLINYKFRNSDGQKQEYSYEYKYDNNNRVTYMKEYINKKMTGFASAEYDKEGFIKQLSYDDVLTFDFYYEDNLTTGSNFARDNHVLKKVVQSTTGIDDKVTTYFIRSGINKTNWTFQVIYDDKKDEIVSSYIYYDNSIKNYENAFEVFNYLPMDLWIGETYNFNSTKYLAMNPVLTTPFVLENASNLMYRQNNVADTTIAYTQDQYISYIKDKNNSSRYYTYNKKKNYIEVFILNDLGENGCLEQKNCSRYDEEHLIYRYGKKDIIEKVNTKKLSEKEYKNKLSKWKKLQSEPGYNVALEDLYGHSINKIIKDAKESFISDFELEEKTKESIKEIEENRKNNENKSHSTDKTFMTPNKHILPLSTTDEIISKLNAKEKEIIFFVNNDYSDVDNMFEILQKISDNYGISISYYNLDNMTSEDEEKLYSIMQPNTWMNSYDYIPPCLAELNGEMTQYRTLEQHWTYDFYVSSLINNMFLEHQDN